MQTYNYVRNDLMIHIRRETNEFSARRWMEACAICHRVPNTNVTSHLMRTETHQNDKKI